jgi:hypothetical protein
MVKQTLPTTQPVCHDPLSPTVEGFSALNAEHYTLHRQNSHHHTHISILVLFLSIYFYIPKTENFPSPDA